MTATPHSSFDLLATALFAVALVHTFSTRHFERLARRFPSHAGLFRLLGEVEVVFGFWAIVLVAAFAFLHGSPAALAYVDSLGFAEPIFVFVVMVVAASRPVVDAIAALMRALARLAPVRAPVASAWLSLAAIPLAGSLVTEPAAMAIAGALLLPQVFQARIPERLKYLALGVLFVNVSVGGTLTSFAAPPVIMVAEAWGWDSAFMAATFGWKAALAVTANATIAVLLLRRHLSGGEPAQTGRARSPLAVTTIHFAFLFAVVALAHHPAACLGVFMLFLGFTQAYDGHQDPLIIKEALLVAFFLAGLVVLGGMQQWWLQPLVDALSAGQLFFGATALTALVDNAAITYLGSLAQGLSAGEKYSLVAGAVAGGGLTVIANAPNPAGVAILRRGFEDGSVGAAGLLAGAALPTCVAAAALMLL